MKLTDVAAVLRDAPRVGADKDEPEGTRSIEISDTLANQMAASLEEADQKLTAAEKAAQEAKAEVAASQRARADRLEPARGGWRRKATLSRFDLTASRSAIYSRVRSDTRSASEADIDRPSEAGVRLDTL